ncbi:DUF6977 family protein [Sulfitobacter litoralis]|uniref:DarT1-associated NADAR antitoxin family protein n=1 Tax=Sulfitobacter litoralis TaxID=335975 RepID=UPI002B279F92|nr:hypothetical protein [Sulfitobacter litoralis]
MATRKIYSPCCDRVGVIEQNIEFDWFPGFSVAQKQKSILSLHKQAKLNGIDPVLEISSKSLCDEGVRASAFNLSFEMKKSGTKVSVESAFQGSKMFQYSGPFPDLYDVPARQAKKEIRIRQNGALKKFVFFGKEFPLVPITFFYDWLYVKTLSLDEPLLEFIQDYKGFSDIEFNPSKSLNCQAYSAALAVSLFKNGLLEDALVDEFCFKEILQDVYVEKDDKLRVQSSLI